MLWNQFVPLTGISSMQLRDIQTCVECVKRHDEPSKVKEKNKRSIILFSYRMK